MEIQGPISFPMQVTGAILRLPFLFSLRLGYLAVEDPGPILSESEMNLMDSCHYQFSKNGIPRSVLSLEPVSGPGSVWGGGAVELMLPWCSVSLLSLAAKQTWLIIASVCGDNQIQVQK